jgi:hypothetical protein
VNPENYSISPPDVHSIDLCLGMQTLYIRCAVWIFKFAEVVEDMFPDFLRILFERFYYASFNLNIHGYTPAILPFLFATLQKEGLVLRGCSFSLIPGC